jgi:hypothetical protein
MLRESGQGFRLAPLAELDAIRLPLAVNRRDVLQ